MSHLKGFMYLWLIVAVSIKGKTIFYLYAIIDSYLVTLIARISSLPAISIKCVVLHVHINTVMSNK